MLSVIIPAPILENFDLEGPKRGLPWFVVAWGLGF